MANTIITKRAIQAAFMEILNEKPLGKITVKDVADRCGINRNTFYYHYQDVPALLEEICANEVTRLISEYPTIRSIEECIEATMNTAIEHKRAIMHIYQSDNRGTYVASLWRMCEYTVTTYIDAVIPKGVLSESDREIFIRYHKCECFGMIIDWISTGMQDDYIQGIHRYFQLRKDTAEDVILRAAKNR